MESQTDIIESQIVKTLVFTGMVTGDSMYGTGGLVTVCTGLVDW
jgi:hypothetical protein